MGHQVTSAEYPGLETLWWEDDIDSLKCCACNAQIAPDALIRTFRLRTPYADRLGDEQQQQQQQQHSRILQVPGHFEILLYDRHFGCFKGTPYVAVSHMWDPEVSKAQNAGKDSTPSAAARTAAYQLPIKIYTGLLESLAGEEPEMWHDYISVPQWNSKETILMAIPQIFSKAYFTLVHLHDVPRASVLKLRSDSSEERIKGVVEICNGLWFRRIWTAMEFVRSHLVRVMMSDYKLVDGVNDLFLEEMDNVWSCEVSRLGNVFRVEQELAEARDGNLVPWMLGPLRDVSMMKTTVFAHAYTLLSTRICSQKHDFFYALLGVVRTNLKEAELESDDRGACDQIARSCLEAGDYSPLLMALRDPAELKFFSYHDVSVWGLGEQTSRPTLADGLSVQPEGWLRLKADNIGTINFARHVSSLFRREEDFLAVVVDEVLDHTGPEDLEAFVSTLGTRIFGQDAQEIMDRLCTVDGNLQLLKGILHSRYNDWSRPYQSLGKEQARAIGSAMGFFDNSLTKGTNGRGETPMSFVQSRGETIHGKEGVFFRAACPVCHQNFLFRAVLIGSSPSTVLHATAYRIPGLSYKHTLRDGVGIIVKENKVIGRMVWARPACSCRPIEEVNLKFPIIPMPEPCIHKYGGK